MTDLQEVRILGFIMLAPQVSHTVAMALVAVLLVIELWMVWLSRKD